jgi:hypothetical protein
MMVFAPLSASGLHVLLLQYGLAVDEHLVALNGDHFAGVLVHEILHPAFEHAGSELASHGLLQGGLGHLDLIGQAEDLQDLLVALKADGTEQGGDGQFLLAVDVGVHHAVDVRGELDPAALEGDHTGAVELGAVGVAALAEEHAGAAVQLAHDHAFGAVHHEGTLRGHVGDLPQVNVLHDRLEVLMLGIGAVKLQLGLQGHAVGKAALNAFVDAVARGVDEVVEEFQHELVAGVRDGEILHEDLVEALALAVLREGLDLEELLEAFELDVEEIGVLRGEEGGTEADARIGAGVGLRLGHVGEVRG